MVVVRIADSRYRASSPLNSNTEPTANLLGSLLDNLNNSPIQDSLLQEARHLLHKPRATADSLVLLLMPLLLQATHIHVVQLQDMLPVHINHILDPNNSTNSRSQLVYLCRLITMESGILTHPEEYLSHC